MYNRVKSRTEDPVKAGDANKLGTWEELKGTEYWIPVLTVRALW